MSLGSGETQRHFELRGDGTFETGTPVIRRSKDDTTKTKTPTFPRAWDFLVPLEWFYLLRSLVSVSSEKSTNR